MNLFRIVDLIVLALFFGTVPLIIIIQGSVYYYWDRFLSLFEEDFTEIEYDFIIVGGGSAGVVLKNRLSKNNRVLLLEAGGNPLWHNYIPVMALEMVNRPQVDWMYKTVPQKHSHFSMENKQGIWPRGKVLGGSSTLNYMIYIRGNPLDYEVWQNHTGDDSWNYENMLHYFKKSLIYDGEFKNNEKHYGSNPYGYLHVQKREKPQPVHDMIIAAARERGFDKVDLNGPQRTGFASIEATQKQGSRCSAYTAFIEPILDRKNLKILRYAHVTKIKLDSNRNARGVWFTRHGRKYYVRAKEIILSAGAINSPMLLMLSGIGPKQHLNEIGIKPKIDLPVGRNLKDHLMLLISTLKSEKPISILPEQHFGLDTIMEYFINGSGHLTFPSLLHTQAFITTSVAKRKHQDWPDIQLYFTYAGAYENAAKDASWLTGVKREIFDKVSKPLVGSHGVGVAVALVRPKSVGTIKLSSRDPFDSPVLDPRYLEHPDDVKAIVEGLRFAVDLVENTKAFKEAKVHLVDIKWPGCEKYELRSDKYWECFARHAGFTVYHPVGTCKMGKGVNDPTAVVDSKLRVLKVKGLRVVDASIMPEIVNGNTNAPVIAIAEKAADMIRQYWSEQYLVCNKGELLFESFKEKCFYTKMT